MLFTCSYFTYIVIIYVLMTCSFHFVYRNSAGARTDTSLRPIIAEMHMTHWVKNVVYKSTTPKGNHWETSGFSQVTMVSTFPFSPLVSYSFTFFVWVFVFVNILHREN